MAKFPPPPIRTDFIQQGQPAPTFWWEQWFQAVADFLSSPAIPLVTPTTSIATGVAGTITYDANFLYVCVATNQWKRVALVAF